MPKGRQCRALTAEQVQRLEKFRRAPHKGAPHGYSLPQLRLAMGAQLSWKVLKKALQGRPVWDLYHSYIVQWMDRFLPSGTPVMDFKSRAAGEREEPETAHAETDEAPEPNGQQDEEAPAPARTVRGSR